MSRAREAMGVAPPEREGAPHLFNAVPSSQEVDGGSARSRAVPLRARPAALWADFAPPVGLVAAVVLAWELAVAVARWPGYLVPRPTAVGERLLRDPGFFLAEGSVTLAEAMGGLVVGAGGAFAIGTLMAHWRLLERALLPLAILVKVTPVVTVAPLLVLWFGFGPVPKVLIAALLTFFPMLIATVSGLRSLDPTAYDVLRTLRASRAQVFWMLRVPSAVPQLLPAAKVCATLSLIGTVVAEWVGADRGLGRAILLANTNLDTSTVFAGVLTLGVMGVALVGLLTLLERRVLFWHESQLSQAAERDEA